VLKGVVTFFIVMKIAPPMALQVINGNGINKSRLDHCPNVELSGARKRIRSNEM
jgi:hypothetical protein